ncbi:superoxide dismutase family protein [Thermomonospora umbrina]|uniref:Cu-Zn family superoxide dismutase n=1 Tax=Thermomonospora umbrina TaxID=111806 RepID=A0A3D9SW44_9ACTN|nr:superoxide dismutase family protein [Thermomonospora umbrina]REE95871.1 Cu-Zn family superoxide dismutase [Thermomonospora umbrina]
MPLLRHTALIAAATGAVAVTGVAVAPSASSEGRPRIIKVHGPTHVYAGDFRRVRTTIRVGEIGRHTWVTLKAAGFPKAAVGRTFGVHVHVNRCGPKPADAGPHFHSPQAPHHAPLIEREVWLDVTVGPDRVGRSAAMRPWRIPEGKAGSVVIHAEPTDPRTGDAGDRLLCTTVPFGRR